VAEKTGWSEHVILWEIPYLRLTCYQHAILSGAGLWTVPKAKPITNERLAPLAGYLRTLNTPAPDAEDWF
jgi:hypothetical protein